MTDIDQKELELILDFPSEDTQYIYNGMCDFVGDNILSFYDADLAMKLNNLIKNMEGAEFAVVLQFGRLGVMAEFNFLNINTRKKVMNNIYSVYIKYNGSQGILCGVSESDCICAELFIPAQVMMNNYNLSKRAINDFSIALS